jgi:hypothetical protein
MSDKIKLYTIISSSQDRIFKAWLKRREHEQFTGCATKVSSKERGKLTVWDDYISGENILIKPNERII